MVKMTKKTAYFLVILVIALIIGVAVLLNNAFACEESYVSFDDTSYWAVVDEFNELAGSFGPNEQLKSLFPFL